MELDIGRNFWVEKDHLLSRSLVDYSYRLFTPSCNVDNKRIKGLKDEWVRKGRGMAHKRIKHCARFWGRMRPNKRSKKNVAQSLMDKEKFLRAKEALEETTGSNK